MAALDQASVRRVVEALRGAGARGQVVELIDSARTASDAAGALGVPVGAIVKSLVFLADDRPVMALVAGDRQADTSALAALLGAGKVRRADADRVRAATGFAIGGVAPLGHPTKLPVVVDASLARFEVVWAAAGHPYCVFSTDLAELLRLTDGTPSPTLAAAIDQPQP